MYRFALALLFVTVAFCRADAQVVYPAKPEKYVVHLRYRIRAGQDDRIRLYRTMVKHLNSVGFVEQPREDADLEIFDQNIEAKVGTVPSESAEKILQEPHIHSLILIPEGMTLPEEETARVQVRITLPGNLPVAQQVQRHRQSVRHLALLGFQENPSYDHAGYTRLRGSMPGANVLKLLKDVRGLPGGWFVPAVPIEELPSPFRDSDPVRIVEVLPEGIPVGGNVAKTEGEENPVEKVKQRSNKVTADARAALALAKEKSQPVRLEIVVAELPEEEWEHVRQRLRDGADRLIVEGRFSTFVTVRFPNPADIERLAQVPDIVAIRAPRVSRETAGFIDDKQELTQLVTPFAESKLDKLHKLGFRGQKTRVVIIGSEFPDLESHIGKGLPKETKYLDMTAENDPDLLPAPIDPTRKDAPAGIVAARAVHETAPDAEIVLIRVDPSAFHQLTSVAKAVTGDKAYSESLQVRANELALRSTQLETRRTQVVDEYRRALSSLQDEEKAVKRREDAKAALDALHADEAVFRAVIRRFAHLKGELDTLKGPGVVVNTLVWDTGFPLDGLSDFAKMLDEKFANSPVRSSLRAAKIRPSPIWVQASSTAIGRIWTGAFLDHDNNGIMEFAGADEALPAQRWTRELNFLSFVPVNGKPTAKLPAGWKMRVTLQWREPHDPTGYLPREPIFPMTLRLLRQVDPEGKVSASDEMIEVARTEQPVVRVFKRSGSGSYEVVMETTIATEGVYALRIDGGLSEELQLPALRQTKEISPRIVLESADSDSAAKGEAWFATFTAKETGVGVPADSVSAVAVGFRHADGTMGTTTGAGPGVVLRTKPDFLAPGATKLGNKLVVGPAVASGFIGGTAASLLSAGARAIDFKPIAEGTIGPLVVPEQLLQTLQPGRRER